MVLNILSPVLSSNNIFHSSRIDFQAKKTWERTLWSLSRAFFTNILNILPSLKLVGLVTAGVTAGIAAGISAAVLALVLIVVLAVILIVVLSRTMEISGRIIHIIVTIIVIILRHFKNLLWVFFVTRLVWRNSERLYYVFFILKKGKNRFFSYYPLIEEI